MPGEFGRFIKLLILDFFLLESDLIFQGKEELSIHPIHNIVLIFTLSLQDWSIRCIHTNFKPDNELCSPGRIVSP